LAISPHNLSETKNKPTVSLSIRRKWLQEIVREKFPNDLKRIVLNVSEDCKGPSSEKSKKKLSEILNTSNIYRIRGDSRTTFEGSCEIIPREKFSSRTIRELFKNKKTKEVQNMLPKNIFQDIINNGYYK